MAMLSNGKYQEMRRQPALGAAGHYDRDAQGTSSEAMPRRLARATATAIVA